MHRRPAARPAAPAARRAPAAATAAVAALGAVALAFVPPGCGVAPKPVPDPASDSAAADRAGPFEPVSMRVHPLTRLTRDPATGARRIEAHIELIDAWGHGVKSLGSFVLELYRDAGNRPDPAGRAQKRLWTIAMPTGAAASDPFDRVTRTYHLTLADVPADLPDAEALRLFATFTTPSGRQLVATHRFAR